MGIFDIFRKPHSIVSCSILKGGEDRHSHVLFGVDDGIKTLEEALAVLEYDESLGITDVWCTPHVMEDVPNTTEGLKARFAELQQAYDGPLRLHLAAEYMLDNLFEERLKAGDLLTMEEDIILVETSTWNPPTNFYWILKEIMKAGYHPLLAHPERYRYLEDKDYVKLNGMGVRFQLNLGSLTGYYGPTAQKKAKMILKNGWYSHYGSDCHRLSTIKEQYGRETLSDSDLALLNKI